MKHCKELLLLLPLLYSCTTSEVSYDYSPEESLAHPFVQKARAYFEVYASTPMEYELQGMHPGAIAAEWDKDLKLFSISGTLCANVKLQTEATYDAEFYTRNADGVLSAEETYTTALFQRLIVVQSEESGLFSCYLVTVIPDEEHATMNHSKVGEMAYCADPMSRFSGYLLFSTVTTNYGVELQCYKNGDLYHKISIYDLPSVDWFGWEDTVKEIRSYLGMKSFTRHIPVGTFVIPCIIENRKEMNNEK